MSFGSRGVTKLDYGRYLAACLSYLSTRQRDRVGIVTFDDDIVERVQAPMQNDRHGGGERTRLYFEAMKRILDREMPGYAD